MPRVEDTACDGEVRGISRTGKRGEYRRRMTTEKNRRWTADDLPHDHCAGADHRQKIDKVLANLPGQEECIQAAELFKLISDGTRLRILWLLCHCEACVSTIAAVMEMSDPAVSHHLKLLRRSGVIVSRREGKEMYYKLADTAQAQLVHRACEDMFRIACPLETS